MYNVAEVKAVMKKKCYQYANCNLNKNNAYYINDGAIKNAESWWNDYVELQAAKGDAVPEKTLKSIANHLATLKQKYLWG